MKKTFNLEDLDCANCAAKMEVAIKKLDEIDDATVSFMTQKMTIDFSEGADIDKVMKAVKKTVRKIEPDCTVLM